MISHEIWKLVWIYNLFLSDLQMLENYSLITNILMRLSPGSIDLKFLSYVANICSLQLVLNIIIVKNVHVYIFFFTFRKNLSKCYDEINLIFTNNILFLELQIFFPHPVSLPMPSFLIQNLINLIQVFKNHLFISQCLQGFFFFLFCLLNLLHFMGVGCKLVRQISDTSFFLTYLPCPLGCDTQY